MILNHSDIHLYIEFFSKLQLKDKKILFFYALVTRVPLPARHHQSRQTLEEAHVSFLLQVVQHFLHKEPEESQRSSAPPPLAVPRIQLDKVPTVVYLLHQDVAAVQDGDAELKGDGHHGTESA